MSRNDLFSRDYLTRRDFLKGSAAAAATVAVFGAQRAQAEEPAQKSPEEPIRAGIIGTGAQGTFLLSNAVKVPGVEIVACCDIYEPHLEKSLILAPDAEPYLDYRRLLDRKDIQAVIIATPLHLHAQMSIDAMDAGKHVFCEKMMAYSIEQAKAMARKQRETGKVLQLGHQRRVNSTYRHAYRMLNVDKVCGRVTQVRAQWHRNGSWRRAVPDKSLEKQLNWRLYREYSQGLMAELGSHQIDAVNWFLNALPVSVMASGGIDYWKDGRTVYDNISVIYEYPGGIRCTYTCITTNEHEAYYEMYMGDEGTLVVTPEKGLLFREPKAEQLVWAPMAHKDESKGKEAIVLDAGATRRAREGTGQEEIKTDASQDDYYVELEEFFQSVRTGKKPASDPESALQSCVTCLMANHAAQTGRKIQFNEKMFQI